MGWFFRGILWLVGAFFVVRAVMEFFVVDFGNPESYRNDWGGPSLAGVLFVHCAPGVIAGALMVRSVLRRREPR
jgi:hypothetical protein